MKLQIDNLQAEKENLNKTTSVILQEQIKSTKELEDIVQIKERYLINPYHFRLQNFFSSMTCSIDLSRKSCIFLEEQVRHYEEKAKSWRQKYSELISEHNFKIDFLKSTVTKDLPLYKKVEELKSEEKRLLVNLKNKMLTNDAKKESKKKKLEIARQIYNGNIVQFVKVCQTYKFCTKTFAQIKYLEQKKSELEMRFNELKQITGSCWITINMIAFYLHFIAAQKNVQKLTEFLSECFKGLDDLDKVFYIPQCYIFTHCFF